MIAMVFFELSDKLDFLTMALCWWYGVHLVSHSELSATKFFIFISIPFGSQVAGFTFGFTKNFSKGYVAANRILYQFKRSGSRETRTC